MQSYLCNDLLKLIFIGTDNKTLRSISVLSKKVNEMISKDLNQRKIHHFKIKEINSKIQDIFSHISGPKILICGLEKSKGKFAESIDTGKSQIGAITTEYAICRSYESDDYDLFVDPGGDEFTIIKLNQEQSRKFLFKLLSTYEDVLIRKYGQQ